MQKRLKVKMCQERYFGLRIIIKKKSHRAAPNFGGLISENCKTLCVGGRYPCRCHCWLWTSSGKFQVQPFSCWAKERSNPHSLPRFNSCHFKQGCLNCDCEHLPAESPSKVSCSSHVRESLGTPCSHYKGNRSSCPPEPWLTFRFVYQHRSKQWSCSDCRVNRMFSCRFLGSQITYIEP